MARVQKTVRVCDEGGHEARSLHTVMLTIDGRAKKWDLCPRHVQPWLDLLGGELAKPRARVFTQRELRAMRR
jgi:hypothetical protein